MCIVTCVCVIMCARAGLCVCVCVYLSYLILQLEDLVVGGLRVLADFPHVLQLLLQSGH